MLTLSSLIGCCCHSRKAACFGGLLTPSRCKRSYPQTCLSPEHSSSCCYPLLHQHHHYHVLRPAKQAAESILPTLRETKQLAQWFTLHKIKSNLLINFAQQFFACNNNKKRKGVMADKCKPHSPGAQVTGNVLCCFLFPSWCQL